MLYWLYKQGGTMSKSNTVVQHAPSGFIMFVAYVAALVYFLNQSNGFWDVVASFFQAIVWPGYLLYYAFQALGV